jgi:hypothetical protein
MIAWCMVSQSERIVSIGPDFDGPLRVTECAKLKMVFELDFEKSNSNRTWCDQHSRKQHLKNPTFQKLSTEINQSGETCTA